MKSNGLQRQFLLIRENIPVLIPFQTTGGYFQLKVQQIQANSSEPTIRRRCSFNYQSAHFFWVLAIWKWENRKEKWTENTLESPQNIPVVGLKRSTPTSNLSL